MKIRFENTIALILSALLVVPFPALARGFGGGGGHFGGGGGFGGGHSFGGGSFGGGHSFGGSSFGGGHSFGGGGFGGEHSFGGGNLGGEHGFGGGDGFGGSHGFGNGEGFAGKSGFGSGAGFGGEHGFGNNQGFAGSHGFGNGSGFGGNQGFGNHGSGFGGNQGFGNGSGFAGNHGLGNRPGFDGFGGNNGAHSGGFGNGNFSGNHPNFNHFPNEGGFNGISGNMNHTPHNFTQNQLNDQGKSIRNSFNNTTVNNFNHYGGNFNGYHNGFNNGYWHGYANGFYHGSWAYPGSWFCPMWSEGAAWTFMGVSALTSFLGLAMIASGSHHGNNNNGSGGGNVTNITYEGDNVYINGQPNCSAAQYYTQAQNLAAQAYTQPNTSTYSDFYDGFPNNGQPTSSPADADEKWEPLGVFALAEPGETQSNMLLQLAINQGGIVRGNYMNQLTDEKSQVYGALDKKTQRISWTIGQNKNTVFDTSLSTLCQNDSQVLVHYGPNNTQEMALIRLQNNSDSKNSGSTGSQSTTPDAST